MLSTSDHVEKTRLLFKSVTSVESNWLRTHKIVTCVTLQTLTHWRKNPTIMVKSSCALCHCSASRCPSRPEWTAHQRNADITDRQNQCKRTGSFPPTLNRTNGGDKTLVQGHEEPRVVKFVNRTQEGVPHMQDSSRFVQLQINSEMQDAPLCKTGQRRKMTVSCKIRSEIGVFDSCTRHQKMRLTRCASRAQIEHVQIFGTFKFKNGSASDLVNKFQQFSCQQQLNSFLLQTHSCTSQETHEEKTPCIG